VHDADDWKDLDAHDVGGLSLKAELLREVGDGHMLYGVDVLVVARRFSQDDILVSLAGREGCAAVHLTWSQARERPPYPMTTFFASVEEAKRALSDE
jgi:hypothetical protein